MGSNIQYVPVARKKCQQGRGLKTIIGIIVVALARGAYDMN
jgi:hypothetical protein